MALAPTELLEAAHNAIEAVQAGAVIDGKVHNGDEVTIHVNKGEIVEIVKALRADSDLRMDMLSDITSIDYLNLARLPRFDVVYHLYSLPHYHRLRLKAPVDEAECSIDTITSVWSGANFMEREIYDLMGIEFDGHPNMTRILMPENWEGHPLRKDFPIGGAKSFYYKHETDEYAGEPDDLVPRIRVQDGDI